MFDGIASIHRAEGEQKITVNVTTLPFSRIMFSGVTILFYV